MAAYGAFAIQNLESTEILDLNIFHAYLLFGVFQTMLRTLNARWMGVPSPPPPKKPNYEGKRNNKIKKINQNDHKSNYKWVNTDEFLRVTLSHPHTPIFLKSAPPHKYF